MSVAWEGDQFINELQQKLGNNLEAAAIYYKEKVKESLNRTQPYQRYTGETGVYYKGEDPSTPGEAPKKITGFLQRSIAHAMSPNRQQAFVGTNLDYGLYLELGTSKMAARPFLRSTLAAHQDAISRIVATGKK